MFSQEPELVTLSSLTTDEGQSEVLNLGSPEVGEQLPGLGRGQRLMFELRVTVDHV